VSENDLPYEKKGAGLTEIEQVINPSSGITRTGAGASKGDIEGRGNSKGGVDWSPSQAKASTENHRSKQDVNILAVSITESCNREPVQKGEKKKVNWKPLLWENGRNRYSEKFGAPTLRRT